MNIIMLASPQLKRTLPTQHTSQSVLFRLKLPSTGRKLTNRSLSDSVLSVRSESGMMGRSVRLPNSFYDDHSRLYEQRSKALVERSTSFQSRPISLSERRRYESQRTETVVERRKRLASLDSAPLAKTDPKMRLEAREQAKLRFKDIMQNKYRRLQHGESFTRVSKTILQRSVTQTLSNRPNTEWKSPFLSKQPSPDARPLKQRPLERVLGNQDTSQLKVLNLDRLFRVKDGKLGNVIPLPVAKLSLVSHRSTMMKAVQTKDKLQEVIKDYNDLLRMMTLKKASGKLGIRGKNFTKSPTIEELMGIKLGPQKNASFPRSQYLDPTIFTTHCKLFLTKIKKDVHLVRRILGGLTQQENSPGLSLGAFTRFNLLFGTGAGLDEKASFLTYFFIPLGQQRIDFPVLRLILELMCQQLPEIGELRVQTDLISQQEKSRIFLQALHRVLFGEMQSESKGGLSRNNLKSVLLSNPDASDLMIRLLQQQ